MRLEVGMPAHSGIQGEVWVVASANPVMQTAASWVEGLHGHKHPCIAAPLARKADARIARRRPLALAMEVEPWVSIAPVH